VERVTERYLLILPYLTTDIRGRLFDARGLPRLMGEDQDISDVSGLPDELGIDEDLGRAEQRLTVRKEERTYGKAMTIVEGFDESSVDVSDLASDLKSALATGGTVDEGRIELQGDHARRVRELLENEGFKVGG